MRDEWEKSQEIRINGLRAQVAKRDATIERYAMESVAKDMRIESLTASLEDMRNRWKDAEQDWMQLRAEIAERDATIAELRAQVAKRDELIAQVTKILGGYPDSDLLSLATTVAAGYERWCNGHDAQVDSLRAQVATLTERLSRCTCTDDYGDVAE